MIEQILFYVARVLAVIFVLAPHEFAHAFVAYKNGDPTAKFRGRMTLNPLKHIDPIGFITCALVGFGWAKPVPIDPYNFKNYRKGMFLTAIAGVVVNYIIAFIAFALYLLFFRFVIGVLGVPNQAVYYLFTFVRDFLYYVFALSLCSVVFNLLPLYPLDGFRVIEAFTREINPVRKFLQNYGQMILIVLIVESFLCDIMVRNGVTWADNLDILNYIMVFATQIIGWPIQASLGWISAIGV